MDEVNQPPGPALLEAAPAGDVALKLSRPCSPSEDKPSFPEAVAAVSHPPAAADDWF